MSTKPAKVGLGHLQYMQSLGVNSAKVRRFCATKTPPPPQVFAPRGRTKVAKVGPLRARVKSAKVPDPALTSYDPRVGTGRRARNANVTEGLGGGAPRAAAGGVGAHDDSQHADRLFAHAWPRRFAAWRSLSKQESESGVRERGPRADCGLAQARVAGGRRRGGYGAWGRRLNDSARSSA
jgi:hypothetical protein